MIRPSLSRPGLWLPLGFALAYLAVLVANLANGVPSHWDEYLTLTRSQSFSHTGDWAAVHLNGDPDFRKPPLQYWMTALVMKTGAPPVVAGRLVSVAFTGGLLGAVALLVFAIQGRETDATRRLSALMLALAALFTSSFLLWAARSCLLDSGMAFFVTLTLAALLLVERSSKWWFVAAAAAGLGALHKSHFTVAIFFLFGIAILVRQFRARPDRTSLRSLLFPFAGAALLCLALAAFWPVLQTIRFGEDYLAEAFGTEVVQRVAPTGESTPLSRLFELTGWMLQDSGVFLCFGLAALFLLPLARDLRSDFRILLPTAFVLMVIAGLMMASGKTYERYILAFTPVLAAVAAVIWAGLASKWPKLSIVPLLMLAAVAIQVPALRDVYAARNPQFERIRTAAGEFGARVAGHDEPVIVRIYGVPASAFLFWSGLDREVTLLMEERLNDEDPEELREVPDHSTLRGVAHFSQLALVSNSFRDREVVVEHDCAPYIVWRAAPVTVSAPPPPAPDPLPTSPPQDPDPSRPSSPGP